MFTPPPLPNSFGTVHVLVNNAGIQPPATNKMLHELPSEGWHKVLSVNLHGVYYTTSAALKYMVNNAEVLAQQKEEMRNYRESPGVIINIGSVQVGGV